MASHNVKKQISAACRYSYNRLALNYYMYYEIWTDHTGEDPEIEELNQRFHQLLGGFLEGSCQLEELEELRSSVMKRMEAITACTDFFQVYEYVLNRLEPRFYPDSFALYQETDEERLAWLIQFIREGKDSLAVNQRVQMVMGQLPLRLTKDKFYSLVQRGMEAYIGASLDRMEDIWYSLKSEAMLCGPKDGEGFQEFRDWKKEFSAADYKHMDQETYDHLADLLRRCGLRLTDLSSETVLFMELINDLYVLMLTRSRTPMEVQEERCLKDVLEMVRDRFLDGHGYGMGDQEAELLRPLEGRQEACYAQWEAVSSEDLGNGPLDETGDLLRRLRLLLSTSAFMSLEEKTPSQGTLTQEILNSQMEGFIQETTERFRTMSRPAVRAVMAKVLSVLPVFFDSMDEAAQYMKGCLESCGDEGEKAASMKLIRQLAKDQQ